MMDVFLSIVSNLDKFIDGLNISDHFKANLQALFTSDGILQWMMTGFGSAVVLTIIVTIFTKGKKFGLLRLPLRFISCYISVMIGHALIQILTGIPIKYIHF